MKMNSIKTIFSFVILAIAFSGCKKEPFEWEDTNGPTESTIEMVDLGLSVKWASCNIGAVLPWQCGNYYSWGEINTKSNYNEDFSITSGKSMGDISGNADYDAARAVWGGKWRLPTKEEFDELINECYWSFRYGSYSGKKGYSIKGPNGNEIFLPLTGFYKSEYNEQVDYSGNYWCSTPYNGDIWGGDNNDNYAYSLYFYERNESKSCYYELRNKGFCIRPVSD